MVYVVYVLYVNLLVVVINFVLLRNKSIYNRQRTFLYTYPQWLGNKIEAMLSYMENGVIFAAEA